MNSKKVILVTGIAGFIGFHLSKKLLDLGHRVIGIDNINDYYDTNLKYNRLNELGISKEESRVFGKLTKSKLYNEKLLFFRVDLINMNDLQNIFKNHKFDMICHLAAQAGVRYSISNPESYISSNIIGFFNILELTKEFNIKKLVYASSSSVYGNTQNIPFNEADKVDNPVSLYADTKKSNELFAHVYSNLHGIKTIGLRFFTVYGPWGRPDMAPMLFAKAINSNKPINVFNNGDLKRDFTYIDDIVAGVIQTLLHKSKSDDLYNIYNVGNSKPVNLMNFISILEKKIGVNAEKIMQPMQPGDVSVTYADTSKLENDFAYKPKIDLEEGIGNFINWFNKYYNDEI